MDTDKEPSTEELRVGPVLLDRLDYLEIAVLQEKLAHRQDLLTMYHAELQRVQTEIRELQTSMARMQEDLCGKYHMVPGSQVRADGYIEHPIQRRLPEALALR